MDVSEEDGDESDDVGGIWIELEAEASAVEMFCGADSSSSPQITSSIRSQLRGKFTSIRRHSHGLAASRKSLLTKQRQASVFRDKGSDQYGEGKVEGASRGTSYVLR